jgi:hypothetical protein
MIKITFFNKGLCVMTTFNENPKIISQTDKPIEQDNNKTQKVDINVLKARAKTIQDKESFKNTTVIILILAALGAAGIFFSI